MTPPATPYRYHAFLSYRHVERDRKFARDLLRKLEARGFKVAIDERDFRPRATFLEEMERCIRESQYTLAILTSSYFQSGNTEEEAVITKVLDMRERRRRLIPLVLEPVERPIWLYNLVGVDFGAEDPLVDPFERLVEALRDGVVGSLEPASGKGAPVTGEAASAARVASGPILPPKPALVSPPLGPAVRTVPRRRRLGEESLISLLEGGITGVSEEARARVVTQAVAEALPLGPESLVPLGLSAWALDYFPSHSPDPAERKDAGMVRDELLAPLRERRPPPPQPGPDDPDWAEISGGSFEMGTPSEIKGLDHERPVHCVTLAPFRLLVHPVTNREFRQFDPKRVGEDSIPVADADWYTAYAYAAWLGGRLPTEAEWEYAARAGSRHAYVDRFGAPTTLKRVCWYGGNSGERLHAVEELEMNPWGLFDMIGNVWEWVADWYGPYPEKTQENPWGPPCGEGRVLRGGSFATEADWVRSTYRGRTPQPSFESFVAGTISRYAALKIDEKSRLQILVKALLGSGYVKGDCGFRVVLPEKASVETTS